MSYLSPEQWYVSLSQDVDDKGKKIKCLHFYDFIKFELKLRDTYVKYSNFSPKNACKCLQIPHFGDTWRHLRDTYSLCFPCNMSILSCKVSLKYSKISILETLITETLAINPLYMRIYGCFHFQISVSKCLHLSSTSVS